MALLNIDPKFKIAPQTNPTPKATPAPKPDSAQPNIQGGNVQLGKAGPAIGGAIKNAFTPNNTSPTLQMGGKLSVPIGAKAANPQDNIKPPTTTLPEQFKTKTTGTEAGDLSKGLISNAPLQSSTQGGTNATQGVNDASNIKAPPGYSYDGKGNLIPDSGNSSSQTNTGDGAGSQGNQSTNTQNGGQNGSLYGGLIGQLAYRGMGDSPEVQKAREALTASQLAESRALGYNAKPASGGGVSADTGFGNDALTRALYGNEQNALSQQLGSAVTTQGQQIGALQGAAGFAQPVGQFGMLTNPVTGQPLNPALFSAPIQQALLAVRNGANPNDPQVQSLISPLGIAGQTQFAQGLQELSGGTYNPTSYSTQIGTNQSNLANTQTQAYQISQSLQQVNQIEPLIKNFLQTSGVNPYDASIYNGPVNDYLAKVGKSGVIPQWMAQMSELKNFTSQLLASGYGGTPTGTEAATLSQDPSQLSYSQMQAYLQTLRDLGGNRLNVLQNNIASLGGGPVGYAGAPATTTTSTQPAPGGTSGFGTGITSPAGQFAAGGALGIVPGAASAATQGGVFAIGSKLLKMFGL